jgi:hypothetical protein
MAWRDEEWNAAATAAEKLEKHLLDAVRPHLATLPI